METVEQIVEEMRRCVRLSRNRVNVPQLTISTWLHLAERIETAWKVEKERTALDAMEKLCDAVKSLKEVQYVKVRRAEQSKEGQGDS